MKRLNLNVLIQFHLCLIIKLSDNFIKLDNFLVITNKSTLYFLFLKLRVNVHLIIIYCRYKQLVIFLFGIFIRFNGLSLLQILLNMTLFHFINFVALACVPHYNIQICWNVRINFFTHRIRFDFNLIIQVLNTMLSGNIYKLGFSIYSFNSLK